MKVRVVRSVELCLRRGRSRRAKHAEAEGVITHSGLRTQYHCVRCTDSAGNREYARIYTIYRVIRLLVARCGGVRDMSQVRFSLRLAQRNEAADRIWTTPTQRWRTGTVFASTSERITPYICRDIHRDWDFYKYSLPRVSVQHSDVHISITRCADCRIIYQRW